MKCKDCVHGYPEQRLEMVCSYFDEKYGTPCDKYLTEREERIKKLEKRRNEILKELDELYQSSDTSVREEGV